MLDRVVSFFEEIANNPVDSRKRGLQSRTASMKMRALALGLLLGIGASLAVGLYDWRSRASSLEG